MVRRSQGRAVFAWFQEEIKLPKKERIVCHEARNWVYRGSQQWSDALDGMLEFRRHRRQASGSHCVPTTDEQQQRQLSLVAQCSRILSLQEFIRYDETLREHVHAMDARKREERRLKREQQRQRQLWRQQQQQEEEALLLRQYEEREEQADAATAADDDDDVVVAADAAAAVVEEGM